MLVCIKSNIGGRTEGGAGSSMASFVWRFVWLLTIINGNPTSIMPSFHIISISSSDFKSKLFVLGDWMDPRSGLHLSPEQTLVLELRMSMLNNGHL